MVRHNLIDDQKSEHVKIGKEILKLLNDGRHENISRIIIGDERYIPFLTFQPSKKVNNVSLNMTRLQYWRKDNEQ